MVAGRLGDDVTGDPDALLQILRILRVGRVLVAPHERQPVIAQPGHPFGVAGRGAPQGAALEP